MRTLIRELYDVETDGTDWPKGISEEERNALIDAVHAALQRSPKGLPLWLLSKDEGVRRALGKAVCLEWRYAVLERACRALPHADKRWVLE